MSISTETEGREDCPAIKAHCDHFAYQCDQNGEMVTVFCDHPDNSNDHEGNCTSFLCPRCTEGGGA